MNGYIRAAFALPRGLLKLSLLKLFHPKCVKFGSLSRISGRTELSMDRGASLVIGDRFNMRENACLRLEMVLY